MAKKVVCCSGLFDPLHYGHVDYLQKAKALSFSDGQPGTLWVIINSDRQAKSKKGYSFMPEAERLKLVRALGCVDAVMIAPDEDDSVCRAITAINPDIFAIGLDEGPEYMKAEKELCKTRDIKIVCPLGARIQSSTWLVEQSKRKKGDDGKTAST